MNEFEINIKVDKEEYFYVNSALFDYVTLIKRRLLI